MIYYPPTINLISNYFSRFVIVLAFCGFVAAPASADVSAAERAALMALYDATKGAFWENNTNWRFGDPCNHINPWYGVTCNNAAAAQQSINSSGSKPDAITETIVELRLGSNNLHGVLPPEIGDFPNLQVLWLFTNELTGTIPPEIGKLGNLTRLNVNNNMLEGPLPESVWNLNKLIDFGVCQNPMNNPITAEIANFTNLETICFGGGYGANLDQPVDLSAGLPAELFELERLWGLLIGASNLNGPIPTKILKLRNLSELFIVDANLSGSIPGFLAELQSLQIINFRNNYLSGAVPESFGELSELIGLSLQGNQLTGELPNSLKKLAKLNSTEIGWNALWTNDQDLKELLNKNKSVDFMATQTLAPENIMVNSMEDTTVNLAWSEVEYKDPGRFQVWYATSSGGPWLDGGATTDKSVLSHTVEGLLSGETYYFTVQTETDPHENNQNKVISARSAEVSTTTGGEPEPFLINAGLNDAWFNPDTDGQGFFITVFPDVGVVVLAWFTYDTELPQDDATANLGAAGHRWLLAVGPFLNDEAILDIEIASGGIFDTTSEITRVLDGSITLSFEGCNSGMVEYNIPSIGRQGSVPIQRVAKDNVVLCEIINEEMHNSQ